MKENTTVSGTDKETVNASSFLFNDDSMQEKLNNQLVIYPVLKFTEKGQTIKGLVIDVINYPNMNEGKGSILVNLNTLNKDIPIVTFWLNTVAQSQMFKVLGIKPNSNATFEEKAKILEQMKDKEIVIRFEGEQKSTKKGYKPYMNYTIVEA